MYSSAIDKSIQERQLYFKLVIIKFVFAAPAIFADFPSC